MAFNEELAQRIRDLIGGSPGFTEKKMFGGIGFLIFGNMACGVNKADLIIRVGPENYQAALSQSCVEFFDLTGRPMTGWIVVKQTGYDQDHDLEGWVRQGVEFARSLPQK